MKTNLTTFLSLALLTLFSASFAQNNALSFDGSDDYVITPDIYSSYNGTSRTIELWFYATSAGVILNEQGSTTLNDSWFDSQIEILSTGEVKVAIWTGLHTSVSVGTVSFNTWNHVALCYNHSSNIIYGFLNGIASLSSSATILMPDTDHLYYSLASYTATNLGSDAWFNGKLDEVRFWDDVRSEAEIRQNMYKELTNPLGESNLIVYYQFNESSGSVADNAEGTASYDGVLHNMDDSDWVISSAIFGPKNCLDFDGYNDYVTTGSALVNLSNDMTVEAWFNTTNSSGYNAMATIEETEPTPNHFYQLLTNSDGKVYLKDANDSPSIISSGIYNDGNWHHAVSVRDADEKKVYLYVDGVLEGSASYTTPGTIDPDMELRFGNSEFENGSYHLNGKLDEIRIWNDVRTINEIRSNMCKTLTGNEANLVGYYTFDNSSGSSLQDLSGNGNDGTLVNMDNSDWISSSAFNTWLNTSSNNHATASNWSTGSIPGSTDNVGIYNFSGSDPVITSNFDCNNFYLESGASFTMNDEASFIAEGNEFINGTFNINKSLTNDSKWHLISMPNNNTTANHFYGDYLQNWNENTGLWEDISDESTPLTAVRGYAFWGTHAKANYTFTGTPNTGEQEIDLTVGGSGDNYKRANAVGNPYPSAIDWNQVSGYGAKYTWNGTAYEAYTSVEGYNIGPQYVAPFQGFFVIPSSSGTFTLNNNVRTHSGADGFEKSSNELTNGVVLFTDNGSYQDKLVVIFNEEAEEAFDQEKDAWKLLSNTEGLSQIYSVSADQKMSIDNRPSCDIIQLGFQNDQNGNYQIGIFDIEGLTAELEDTKTNHFHDLAKGAYSFDWQTSDSEERFILHLKATGVEDIEEQAIRVYAENGKIYLRMDDINEFNEIVLYDLAGRLVFNSRLNQQSLQSFDLSNLRGAFIVQLISENRTEIEKVVLE